MKVKIINKSELPLPKYETKDSAGFDIRASFEMLIDEDVFDSLSEEEKEIATTITIPPKERFNFNTGLYVEIPKGYALLVSGRSGNAMRSGISVTQGYGLIDSDYRGEIKVFLTNHGNKPFIVKHGDRIAQGIIVPVHQVEWIEVDELSETERGESGMGSTGIN